MVLLLSLMNDVDLAAERRPVWLRSCARASRVYYSHETATRRVCFGCSETYSYANRQNTSIVWHAHLGTCFVVLASSAVVPV